MTAAVRTRRHDPPHARNLVVTRLTRSALAPLAVAAVLMAALTGCTDDPSSAKEPPASAAAATATKSSSATESSSSSPSTPTVPSASESSTSDTQDQPGQPGQPGSALAALEALPVRGHAPMTGYDRDQFGTEWDDAVGAFSSSRNGCDTRNDLLAHDLQRDVVESNGCVVDSGVLAYDPYSG
jgi:hypothetical protein